MTHNENSRVKIPAIAHLTRLGYTYLPLKQCKDEVCQDTNIFRSLFQNAVNQLNGRNLSAAEIDRLVAELTIKLSNDDLGRAFYKILLDGMDGLRLSSVLRAPSAISTTMWKRSARAVPR